MNKDTEIANLRIELIRAAAQLHAIASVIRTFRGEIAIECAGIHSMAFCAERNIRTFLENGE